MTGIYSLGSILRIVGKSSFVFYIYPVTGFDAVLVILPGSGNRVGSGNAFFIFYGNGVGSQGHDFSTGCVVFQFVFLMEFIYDLECLYCTGVCIGELSFIDHADLIACDHTAFTFQGGV